MKETFLAEFDLFRSRTLDIFEGLTDQAADLMPEGFRNNIRWHLGHIYTVHELYIFSNLKLETHLPEHFQKWFGNGSSPADWDDQPASLEELKGLLEQQKKRTLEILSNLNLYDPFDQPIALGSRFQFNRASELLSFMFYHEGNHNGFLKAMRKIVQPL